jgi:hypothetical protein
MKTGTNDEPRRPHSLKTIGEYVGAVGVIIGAIYGAGLWIDSRARDAVLDERFLRDLAGKIRPSCTFDSAGVILSDAGASELIESIKVKNRPQVFGYEVAVQFKKHIANEPLLSGVNINLLPETVTRGPSHTWTFLLTPAWTSPAILDPDSTNEIRYCKFLLEMLH